MGGGASLSQGRGDWVATCLGILKKVEDQLGQSLSIFNAPVDVKIYPEYTKYVDKPMDLGTIRGRLDKRIYRDAQEFCNVSPPHIGDASGIVLVSSQTSANVWHSPWGVVHPHRVTSTGCSSQVDCINCAVLLPWLCSTCLASPVQALDVQINVLSRKEMTLRCRT